MDYKPLNTDPSRAALVITRVADGQWHALEDDLVVGRGHAVRRPDGQIGRAHV